MLPVNDLLQREEDQRRAAEERARRWLREVLPFQAEIYEKFGFIEVPSQLYRGRTYRIHGGEGDFRTSWYEGGKKLARLCMMMLDPEIPPTDRVIAEYYLLQGDEQHYLATANIQNLGPESRLNRGGTWPRNSGRSGLGQPSRRAGDIREGRMIAFFILLLILAGLVWIGLAKSADIAGMMANLKGSRLEPARPFLLVGFLSGAGWLIYALRRYLRP